MINTVDNLKSTFSPKRQELSEYYIPFLAQVLNEFHGKQLSIRFWTFLLQKYVGTAITNFETYNSLQFKVNITNEPVMGFGKPSLKTRVIKKITQLLKGAKSIQNEKEIHRLLQRHNSLHIGFPFLNEVNEDLGTRLPDYIPVYNFSSTREMRNKLQAISKRYEDTFLRNLINNLPKIYIEGFNEVFDSIALHEPKAKTFHYHIASGYYDWLLAKYSENGALLYWYQHGAYYGELQFGAQVRERKLADFYRTWGWVQEPKDQPWKSYRLLKFKKNYAEITNQPVYNLLIAFGLINGAYTNKEYYKEFMSEFDRLLDTQKYHSVLARPRPTSKLFSNKSDLDFVRKYNYIKLSSGLNPIVEDIAQSDLIFQVSVPSTNFLECIAIDKPVIGILNNDQMTTVVKPFYDFLLEKKVLHLTLESVVSHLNTLDLDVWWKEIQLDLRYQKFKETFVKTA